LSASAIVDSDRIRAMGTAESFEKLGDDRRAFADRPVLAQSGH